MAGKEISLIAVINSLLTSLSVPFQRLVFKTNKPKATYIVYTILSVSDTNFSDDDTTESEHLVRFDVYSKKEDYTELVKNLKSLLKEYDFYDIEIEAEIYEDDTSYFHVPVEARYYIYEQ